ncbi:MAG: hypothetical protein FWC17_01185 [Treponema sp.]|nr:hypothetical protein [Treponema sp.]MCL2266362.1 hypothetical protein [Treponema sp.]
MFIMRKKLNELFINYLNGNLMRAEFESAVYKYLVFNQEKTCISHWKNDEYEDFVSWFYPRLKTVIDSYRDTGSSFEAYLSKYILISSKEYHVKTVTKSVTEYSAWSARVPDMYAYEEAPVYIHKEAEKTISNLIIDKKGRRSSRRILALILKCYYYISEDFAEKIAPVIGMSSRDLLRMINEIQELRREKDDRLYEMKERLYRQFYRCIVYEKRLSIIKENSISHRKLSLRLEKAKKLLESQRYRITKIKTDASNSQIAQVIGISKGTVDASLSRLKAKWESMSEKADLN